jgi:environmental stress-induced protein Ves
MAPSTEYTIISSESFKSKSWSGGTTTELFIFPAAADYQQRNFQFRLSTATVETEKSDFTSLHGISRKLMVLAGKITLSHEGHYSRQLNKFDVDEFEGDWKTSSVGKCTDFNLMTIGKASGEITAIVMKEDQNVNCKIRENCDWFFIFMYSGKVRIEIKNRITTINKGDLLILNKLTTRIIEIIGIQNSEVILSEITL